MEEWKNLKDLSRLFVLSDVHFGFLQCSYGDYYEAMPNSPELWISFLLLVDYKWNDIGEKKKKKKGANW